MRKRYDKDTERKQGELYKQIGQLQVEGLEDAIATVIGQCEMWTDN